jgi:hypothetical protein
MATDARPIGRSAACLLTTLTIGLSAAAGALAVATPAQASPACVAVSGAPWQLKGHGSGTRYTIEIHGLPCSLAVTWVPKLTRQRGGVGAALKGPTGFRCIAVWASKLAAAGNCSRGQLNFSWGQKPAH